MNKRLLLIASLRLTKLHDTLMSKMKKTLFMLYLYYISQLECSVNVFLIFWKDSERFSMFSYVVSIILMWPIFYIYGECQKYFLLLLFEGVQWILETQNIFQWNYLMRGQPLLRKYIRAICCKYLFCKLESGYLSFVLLQLLCEQAVAFVNLFSNNLMLCCPKKILQNSNLHRTLPVTLSILSLSWPY